MTRPRLDRLDLALLALAAVGLILYLVLIPRYHPDAAATFGIGPEAATALSAEFIERSGYSTDGLTPLTRFSRSPELLDSLQSRLGRRSATIALQEGGREVLPAFYWHVQWRNLEEFAGGEGSAVRVRLLPDGSPWMMIAQNDFAPTRLVDGPILQRALDPAIEISLDDHPETRFAFDISSEIDAADARDILPNAADLSAAQAESTPLTLGPNAAIAIARAHLERTAQANLPLVASRVEPLPLHGRTAARVIFDSEEPVLGQTVQTTVDVGAAGTLLQLETEFNGARERLVAAGSITYGQSGSMVRNVLKYGGYATLILFLLVVALRRLSARALDARAALKDATAVGVMACASILFALPVFTAEFGAGAGMSFFVLILVIVLSNGFLLAVVAFITSAGGDALMRTHDDRPIRTLALARQGSWINVPVGRSLVRGVAIGAGLAGLAALLLFIFSGSPLPVPLQARYFESQNTLSVLGSGITDSFWYTAILTHAAFVGLGAVLARWRPKLLVPVLAVALAALGVEVVKVPSGPEWVMWLGALMVGAFLAEMYRRTDAMTIFVALMTAGIIWSTREALLVPGSPTMIDLVLGFAILAAVVGVGFVGMRSSVTSDTLPVYEPEFIIEQRERARMQREFEIARDVQVSFLPKSVPDIPGLDLAATCVPADEVGGDYYDLIPLGSDRLVIVIGDVSGKGIQAAFYMTLIKGYLTALAHEINDPAEILIRLNSLFRRNAPRGTFISMILGVIDMRACTITFARAGHTPLIIKRAGGDVESLLPAGLAIGMTDGPIFNETLTSETIELCPEDLLVLYTDGVSEAMNRQRNLFSDERVVRMISSGPHRAVDLLKAVLEDVRLHVGTAPTHDDLTMVVVRVATVAREAPSPLTEVDANI